MRNIALHFLMLIINKHLIPKFAIKIRTLSTYKKY